jgi:hypothetical protein
MCYLVLRGQHCYCCVVQRLFERLYCRIVQSVSTITIESFSIYTIALLTSQQAAQQ